MHCCRSQKSAHDYKSEALKPLKTASQPPSEYTQPYGYEPSEDHWSVEAHAISVARVCEPLAQALKKRWHCPADIRVLP